jgi:hypothetical protein
MKMKRSHARDSEGKRRSSEKAKLTYSCAASSTRTGGEEGRRGTRGGAQRPRDASGLPSPEGCAKRSEEGEEPHVESLRGNKDVVEEYLKPMKEPKTPPFFCGPIDRFARAPR